MEYVDGVDLKHVLRESGRLSIAEALEIAVQVAYGLEAIHEAGIIHRDLKTPNIIRDARGVVRLMDFGIAKQLGTNATAATATGLIVGTPEYMSPEQGRGEPVDRRSDIYALGIVIFEIFTGRVPFKGETPVATILKQISDPPPLDEPGVPAVIRPILARALAKSPGDRYASAREMAEAILAVRIPAADPRITPTLSPSVPTLAVPPSVATTVDQALPTRVIGAPGRRRGALVAWIAIGGALGGLAAFVAVRIILGVNPAPGPSPAAPSPAAARVAATKPPVVVVPPTSIPAPPTTLPPLVVSEKTPLATASPVPTRRPVPRSSPTVVETAAPPPAAAPPPVSLAASPGGGFLQLLVVPWAEVSVDGRALGRLKSEKLPLGPGAHTVRLVHPDYQPLQRKVTILPGETMKLVIEMAEDAVPKK